MKNIIILTFFFCSCSIIPDKKSAKLKEYKINEDDIYLDQLQIHEDVRTSRGKRTRLYELVKNRINEHVVANVDYRAGGVRIQDVNSYEDILNYYDEENDYKYTIKVITRHDIDVASHAILSAVTLMAIPSYRDHSYDIAIKVLNQDENVLASESFKYNLREWMWIFYVPFFSEWGAQSVEHHVDELVYDKLVSLLSQLDIE